MKALADFLNTVNLLQNGKQSYLGEGFKKKKKTSKKKSSNPMKKLKTSLPLALPPQLNMNIFKTVANI